MPPAVRHVVLIANENAHIVSPFVLDVIARALSGGAKLEQVLTKRRGHATHVAQGAAHQHADLVVVLGGDGTVNEVVNGLAGSAVPMAALPGGGANILARGLGLPNDPVEATGLLLERLERPPTRIPLGRVDGRYFVSNCGIGLDAAIVGEVERRPGAKRVGGDAFFVWTALKVFFLKYDRRHPHITVAWGPNLEHRRDGVFLAIVQKGDPFTYLGSRAMRICPQVERTGGLDMLGLTKVRTASTIRIALQSFASGKHVTNKHVLHLHDEPRIQITADRPMALQADGEYLGERVSFDIEAVPDALSIVA
jgi:diacylglycerol kinase family enzyme